MDSIILITMFKKNNVMGNVDVEIYLSQLINFFENNPNDLMELIGDVQKEEFYNKIRERCENNLKNGEEISLTRSQIVDIVLELKLGEIERDESVIIHDIEKFFQKTKFGLIGLN